MCLIYARIELKLWFIPFNSLVIGENIVTLRWLIICWSRKQNNDKKHSATAKKLKIDKPKSRKRDEEKNLHKIVIVENMD